MAGPGIWRFPRLRLLFKTFTLSTVFSWTLKRLFLRSLVFINQNFRERIVFFKSRKLPGKSVSDSWKNHIHAKFLCHWIILFLDSQLAFQCVYLNIEIQIVSIRLIKMKILTSWIFQPQFCDYFLTLSSLFHFWY